VVDYCARNFVEMEHITESVLTSSYKNLLKLTILENHEAKTIEMVIKILVFKSRFNCLRHVCFKYLNNFTVIEL